MKIIICDDTKLVIRLNLLDEIFFRQNIFLNQIDNDDTEENFISIPILILIIILIVILVAINYNKFIINIRNKHKKYRKRKLKAKMMKILEEKNKLIDENCLILKELLAEGNFGRVYKALLINENDNDNYEVAVKKIKCGK